MEQELLKKSITITSKEEKQFFTSVLEGKDKYKVYHKLYQKEEPTKAFTQLQQLSVGSTVMVNFKSEDKEFVNEAGKTINFTERVVAYFSEDKGETPAPSPAPSSDVNTRLNTIENRLAKLENAGNAPSVSNNEPLPTDDIKVEDFTY